MEDAGWLHIELGTAVEARQRLESQQQENSTVKKVCRRGSIWVNACWLAESQEFDILDDDANIYKQIGPVLLKQDKIEAVMSVNGRLEFIEKQM
jgi:prefoldin beta subunit